MFEGRVIEAQLGAPGVTVQIFSAEYPTPVETLVEETELTLALQRQPPQHFSNGRYRIEGASRGFGAIGRVLAVPAGVPLEIRASGGRVRAVRCSLSREPLGRTIGRAGLVEPGELDACLDVRDSRIAGTLARMEQEVREPGFASHLLTEALGVSLMVDFSRYLGRMRLPPKPIRGGLTGRQFRLVTEFVQESEAAPSLDALARLAGLSRRHLSRAFKQTSGCTIHEYVEEVRLNRAMSFLGDTNLQLKDIAFRLGFSSPGSFSVAFRRAAGETPQSFRRRMRSGGRDAH